MALPRFIDIDGRRYLWRQPGLPRAKITAGPGMFAY
jgi:hypothetical protein